MVAKVSGGVHLGTHRPSSTPTPHKNKKGADATVVASEGKVHSFPVEKLEKDKLVDTNGMWV